jgi:hypothetical protein
MKKILLLLIIFPGLLYAQSPVTIDEAFTGKVHCEFIKETLENGMDYYQIDMDYMPEGENDIAGLATISLSFPGDADQFLLDLSAAITAADSKETSEVDRDEYGITTSDGSLYLLDYFGAKSRIKLKQAKEILEWTRKVLLQYEKMINRLPTPD